MRKLGGNNYKSFSLSSSRFCSIYRNLKRRCEEKTTVYAIFFSLSLIVIILQLIGLMCGFTPFPWLLVFTPVIITLIIAAIFN